MASKRKRTSRKNTKHNSQYWEQEVSVKCAGKKRQTKANVPNIEGSNLTDTCSSSSQIQEEQPQAKDGTGLERPANKRRKQMAGRGKERVNIQNKKKIESSLSSYSVVCINREGFKDKHKWQGFNVTF